MPRPPVAPGQAHVLVVEDDANNRLVAVKLLKVAGVPPENVVEIEGDAAEYLHTSPSPIDLVLLDLQLPGKDGYAVLQELRADPALADIRVVAVTANVMKVDIEHVRAAGFDGFIGKPIDGRRFPDWIKRLLAGENVWTAVA